MRFDDATWKEMDQFIEVQLRASYIAGKGTLELIDLAVRMETVRQLDWVNKNLRDIRNTLDVLKARI